METAESVTVAVDFNKTHPWKVIQCLNMQILSTQAFHFCSLLTVTFRYSCIVPSQGTCKLLWKFNILIVARKS